jgi:hypothetical protein
VGERTGVLVLGMHRGGTSAVTRAVNLLGVPTGEVEGLKDPSGQNPRGFWEMKALSAFNEKLLSLLGGTWSAPPPLGPGWIDDERLGDQAAAGRELFRELHPGAEWVWKDPRTCITMPFWANALGDQLVIVLVHRHPVEIWRSLEARDGFTKPLALALWERYLRSALEAAAGRPTLVVRYTDALADPSGWASDLGGFLSSAGLSVAAEIPAELEEFLEPGLRHSEAESPGQLREPEASPEQRALHDLLEANVGSHASFDPSGLPEQETAWAEPLLAERRRADLEIEPLKFRVKRLDVELRVAEKRLDRAESNLAEARERVAEREAALQREREALEQMRRSASWRVTRPLRVVGRLARRR